MGFAIMRFSKIKSINQGNAVLAHARRKFEVKTLSHPENKNVTILTPAIVNNGYEDMSFGQILDVVLQDSKPPKKNSVLALEFVMSFSKGSVTEDNLKSFAEASVRFLRDVFSEKNIVSVVLHRDEACEHIHAIVVPKIDGRLCCKHFINGSRSCSELQDKYYEYVKDCGDLQRGINRSITETKHEDFKRYKARLSENQATLDAYQAVYGTPEFMLLDDKIEFLHCYESLKKKKNLSLVQQPYQPPQNEQYVL